MAHLLLALCHRLASKRARARKIATWRAPQEAISYLITLSIQQLESIWIADCTVIHHCCMLSIVFRIPFKLLKRVIRWHFQMSWVIEHPKGRQVNRTAATSHRHNNHAETNVITMIASFLVRVVCWPLCDRVELKSSFVVFTVKRIHDSIKPIIWAPIKHALFLQLQRKSMVLRTLIFKSASDNVLFMPQSAFYRPIAFYEVQGEGFLRKLARFEQRGLKTKSHHLCRPDPARAS